MDKQEFLDKQKSLKIAQKEVLKLFLDNKTDKEIAETLNIGRENISKYITCIAKIFGVKARKDGNEEGTDRSSHRYKLVELCLIHIPDQVHEKHKYGGLPVYLRDSSDKVDRPSTPTNKENITPDTTTTSFDLLGRDTDRQKLIEISQKHKIVLLKAAAGIGKSTLARHFLETQFTKVIRLDMGMEAGNVTPAEEKVLQILRKEFDEEPSRDFQTNLEILREKLSDKSRPIGMLIDDLEPALDANFRFLDKLRGYEDLLRIFGDRDVCSFTLITSRRSLITERSTIFCFPLAGLDITTWQQHFYDCDNGSDSKSLIQMHRAYSGNAKIMHILHDDIFRNYGNIEVYWNQYKDKLLANKEIETLIYSEINWLRDNQSDAYKLFYQLGAPFSQDAKLISFERLLQLLQDIPEFKRNSVIDLLTVRTSLIENKGNGDIYLSPVLKKAANLHWLENIDNDNIIVSSKLNFDLDNESYITDTISNINGQIQLEEQGLHNNFNHFSHTNVNEDFTKEIYSNSKKPSNLVDISTQSSLFLKSVFPMPRDSKTDINNIQIQQLGLSDTHTNTTNTDHKNQDHIIISTTMDFQLPSILSPQKYFG